MIFLLHEAIDSIREGRPRTSDSLENNLPSQIEFSDTDLIGGKLKLAFAGSANAIAIKDEFGGVGHISTYTEHVSNGLIVNVQEYIDDKGLDPMTVPWTITTSSQTNISGSL